MEQKQIKAAAYLRVSTPRQVETGESLSTQRKQVEQFAQQKGWNLVHIYADEGISGAKTEHRTQFQQMLQDAKQGKFNVIIFTKLSRFARNAREYMQFQYELEQQGVMLASIKENIDPTTKTGKMIAGILALFAEWEHETIKEQMQENKMGKWKDHRAFIGKPPYGYKWNKDTEKLEIDPEQSAIYKRIVSMYLDQGLSFQAICDKLNEEGIKSRTGKQWRNIVIGDMMKNPAYYGHLVMNQYIYEDGKQGAGTLRTKKKKPESEHISFPIPPLISKTRWDKIQERIKFNKHKGKRSEASSEYWLRDVLICGQCGGRIRPENGAKRQDGTYPRYYRCYWGRMKSEKRKKAQNGKACFLPFIPAEKVEEKLWAAIMTKFAIGQKAVTSSLFDVDNQKKQVEDLHQTIDRLEKDLQVKEKARERLFSMLEYDDLDENELRKKLRANKDEILTIESRINDKKQNLNEIKQALSQQQQIKDTFSKNKQLMKKLYQSIRELDAEGKKVLVEGMLKDQKIEVDYNFKGFEDEKPGFTTYFKLQFNFDVLQRLADEGKINIGIKKEWLLRYCLL